MVEKMSLFSLEGKECNERFKYLLKAMTIHIILAWSVCGWVCARGFVGVCGWVSFDMEGLMRLMWNLHLYQSSALITDHIAFTCCLHWACFIRRTMCHRVLTSISWNVSPTIITNTKMQAMLRPWHWKENRDHNPETFQHSKDNTPTNSDVDYLLYCFPCQS